jgi:hypothetical protein
MLDLLPFVIPAVKLELLPQKPLESVIYFPKNCEAGRGYIPNSLSLSPL